MSEYYRPTREERRNPLEELSGPVGIRHGKQVKNDAFDQQIIMGLLNRIPAAEGGTLHPTGPIRFKAARGGYCDPSLGECILKFQRAHPQLTADGAVDPGGGTIKAMRTLAAGGKLAAAPAPAPGSEDQRIINTLFALLDAAKAALLDPALAPTRKPQLALLVARLEAKLKASGAKRTGGPDARANVGVAIGLVALVIIAFFVMMMAASETWRKAFNRYVQGLGEAAIDVAKYAVGVFESRMQQAASTVLAIDAEVERVARTRTKCNDEYSRYKVARSSALEKIGRYRMMPGLRFTSSDFEIIDQAITQFMNATWSLLMCMGGSDFARQILMKVAGPGAVIRFIIEQMTSRGKPWVFPYGL